MKILTYLSERLGLLMSTFSSFVSHLLHPWGEVGRGAVILLLLISCQKAEQTYDDTPQGNLDALWTMIDQRYCFVSYKEKELGINWADIHQKYSQRLSPKMSKAQLFEVLCQMLSELKDGHVNLYTSLDVGRNWSWKDDYPLNLDTEVRDQYLGTDYHLAGGMKYRILPDNIGYVVYESFASAVGDGNLTDMFHVMRTTSGIIIDIRGNSGGDLTNCDHFCERFTNEKRLVGYTAHKTGTGHDDFSTPEPEYIEPSKGLRWQKPVVVLTNRSCYSAANTFVRNMREMPLVTIMGDQTGGGSGMPFSSELPIGWSVRFSACPSYDVNMQHTEFGIKPDIPSSLDPTKAQQGIDTMIEQARAFLRTK